MNLFAQNTNHTYTLFTLTTLLCLIVAVVDFPTLIREKRYYIKFNYYKRTTAKQTTPVIRNFNNFPLMPLN